METRIYKVTRCGEAFTVKSEKAETGVINKRYIVLQEPGEKYGGQYAATLLGNDALCNFYPGDTVAAALRFNVHEYNGQTYQDIIVADIFKLNK